MEGEDAWEGSGRRMGADAGRAEADAGRTAGGALEQARGSTVVACRRGKKKMTCGPGDKMVF